MNRLFIGLLFGAVAVTCVLAVHTPHRVEVAEDEEEEEMHHHHHHGGAVSHAAEPKPNVAPLDDAILSLARPTKWTFTPGPFGPSNWGKHYPKCKQLLQAPLNIHLDRVIPTTLKPIVFKGLDAPLLHVHIQNIFRYGNLDFTRCHNKVTIEGGPLPGKTKYHLSSAYFVVGKNRTSGSQTTFNKKGAPFEIGFVFNQHANSTLATENIGSEVVITFLGKIAKPGKHNAGYAPIVEGFKKIVKAGTETITNLKSLKSLFPRKVWQNNYFTYTASSVVPPCTEGRIRVIYQRPIRVSPSQFKALQGLYDEKNKYIWNNYRPQQPSTYVQVFSSIPKVKPATTTTTTAVPNVVEDPYHHHPPTKRTTTTTTTKVPNIVTEHDPYAVDAQ